MHQLTQAVAKLTEDYRLLVEPSQVVELCALDVKRGSGRPHTEAGFFDYEHLQEMAKAALAVTTCAKGVYFTLNPLQPDLLSRRCCRMDWANEGELAKDKDVVRRRWLLVDADPVRDPLISATDAEKAETWAVIQEVRAFLDSKAWPPPIVADSGNGFHLLYRVELPADDSGTVECILKTLAHRFDTPRVKIDQKVFNPARICKLPGTIARKGDNTKARPHRRAKLLEVPGI
jgi:hypothetical protein